VAMDLEKLEAVKCWLQPTGKHWLRSFLRLRILQEVAIPCHGFVRVGCWLQTVGCIPYVWSQSWYQAAHVKEHPPTAEARMKVLSPCVLQSGALKVAQTLPVYPSLYSALFSLSTAFILLHSHGVIIAFLLLTANCNAL
jgi:hypothetical protein